MIIVYLKGGLGNQLFQYAAARSLAHKHNTIVKLDTTAYYYGGPRQYELYHFNIQENVAVTAEIRKLTDVKQNKFQKLLFALLHNRSPLSAHHIRYNKALYKADFFNLPDNIYLEGYFQSEKYFINIADIIRDEFKVKYELTGKNKEIAELMTNIQSVNICVRRGDFITDDKANQKHGVCGLDYYYRCIEQLVKKVKNPHFFVFSNDFDWCRDNLKIQYPVNYIDHQQDKAYEDLRLMSFCKHHIIGNSTFHWWGAWLAPYSDKLVFAPKKWFLKDNCQVDELIPDSWLKI
ncbi:MAG: hypothetical protein CVV39_00565 [Planctomycetes bacterium HGW-Planctomycetes-1]|nr:MAG: hypothetical protein CVV39_00565 [Planctomycetes bacterium HGW-Planctomycetes-1]